MGNLSLPRRAAYIATAAIFFAVFIITVVLNAAEMYRAARPVEFCIVPLAIVLLAIAPNRQKRDRIIVLCALVCTTCADFFMTLFDAYYEISLAFFSAAQLLYYTRILIERLNGGRRYLVVSLCARIAASIAVCMAAPFVMPQNGLLAALAAFYFLNLAINCGEAFALCGHGRQFLLFAIGLLLFVGCDVCVGLKAASLAEIAISGGAYRAVSTLIWVFYAPSQALLALSVRGKAGSSRALAAEKNSTAG